MLTISFLADNWVWWFTGSAGTCRIDSNNSELVLLAFGQVWDCCLQCLTVNINSIYSQLSIKLFIFSIKICGRAIEQQNNAHTSKKQAKCRDVWGCGGRWQYFTMHGICHKIVRNVGQYRKWQNNGLHSE